MTRGPPRNVFEACEAGDKVALDKFVGMGRFNVEAKDINGRTCLHWAAEAGHIGEIDF